MDKTDQFVEFLICQMEEAGPAALHNIENPLLGHLAQFDDGKWGISIERRHLVSKFVEIASDSEMKQPFLEKIRNYPFTQHSV